MVYDKCPSKSHQSWGGPLFSRNMVQRGQMMIRRWCTFNPNHLLWSAQCGPLTRLFLLKGTTPNFHFRRQRSLADRTPASSIFRFSTVPTNLTRAAYKPLPNYMYNNHNNRQHGMPPSAPLSSYLVSTLDQSGMDFTGNWQGAQARYGQSPSPSAMGQHNIFRPTDVDAVNRNHVGYSSSERSTIPPFQQNWNSPSLQPPPSIQQHPSNNTSTTMYSSFRPPVDMSHHPSLEWNQWAENASGSDVMSSHSTSSIPQWPNDMRGVSSFPPGTIEDLYNSTSATNTSSPYSVQPELPTIPNGLQISPLSSPSSSPSAPSRKLSPRTRTMKAESLSPPPSRRLSVDASASGPKVCSHCQATSTPLWRREPATLKPLCNACGLYLQQRHRHRPKELIDADADDETEEEEEQNYNGPECSHCHTHRTSVWRRSKTGAQLCNACGVYLRLRGKDRPLSLKRKKIKPRTKHASTSRST